MAGKAKMQGKASRQKKREGMPKMPESHAHMTPEEHEKAMAKMGGKAKPKRGK